MCKENENAVPVRSLANTTVLSRISSLEFGLELVVHLGERRRTVDKRLILDHAEAGKERAGLGVLLVSHCSRIRFGETVVSTRVRLRRALLDQLGAYSYSAGETSRA